MTAKPAVSLAELSTIPLLRGFTEPQLEKIVELLERVPASGTLFEAGSPAEAFYLLTDGEVVLYQGDEETHRLHGVVLIGELGALTGRTRNARAVVADGAALWQLPVRKLLALFEQDKDIGLGFQQNLINLVADKMQRDQARLQDMRANLIRTQKAMKQMRDYLLESEETAVSSELHSKLEELIAQNRRVNYRVEPPDALRATLRIAGVERPVSELTRKQVTIEDADGLGAGDRVTGVLRLSGPEIPISGQVKSVDDNRARVELDLLIEEYEHILEGYLTRLQMLDFLV